VGGGEGVQLERGMVVSGWRIVVLLGYMSVVGKKEGRTI
jgi:hypothetical protein